MNTHQNATRPPRNGFGRSKLGGGSVLLFVMCLVIAIPLSLLCGWAVVRHLGGDNVPTYYFLATALPFLPAFFVISWFFLVDRESLKGIIKDPESSIEGKWYDRAAVGTFGDLIAVIGVGAGAFSLFSIPVSTGLAFLILASFAAIDLVIRYLVFKKKES